MLRISMDCKDYSLTKHSEGLRLVAYPDSGGWRIGYGSTPDGVAPGMTCTLDQAEQWLKDSMAWRIAWLNQTLDVQPDQNIFNALCDAFYNIIPSEFEQSTLIKLASEGQWDTAWLEVPKWRLEGGTVSMNLLARRRLEQALWKTGDWLGYYTAAHNSSWWPANYEQPSNG